MTELQLLSIGYALFSVLIFGEFLWSRWRDDGGYRLSQVVVNVGHGVVYQVFDGFTKTLVLWPATMLASIWSPWLLPTDAVWAWAVGLLAYDFCSYWRHRHFHEIGLLWAVHGVHHAATDYNLAAALRQAGFQGVFGWPWALPLAIFLPLEMFVGIVVFDFLYQFVQHTRYVPKLGPIGWLMNTPSHHRVHHGTEAQYLDKNYGGIFIFWDRLFGTFEPEGQEPTYGLTVPLRTLNPVWGNFALFDGLFRAAGHGKSWADRAGILFGPPAVAAMWAEGGGRQNESVFEDAAVPRRRVRFVTTCFLALPALLGALAWVPEDQVFLRVGLATVVMLSVVNLSGLLESRWWARPAEAVRMTLAVGVLWALWSTGQGPVLFGVVAVSMSLTVVGGGLSLMRGSLSYRPGTGAH